MLNDGRMLSIGSLDDLRKDMQYQYSLKVPKGTSLPNVIGDVSGQT